MDKHQRRKMNADRLHELRENIIRLEDQLLEMAVAIVKTPDNLIQTEELGKLQRALWDAQAECARVYCQVYLGVSARRTELLTFQDAYAPAMFHTVTAFKFAEK